MASDDARVDLAEGDGSRSRQEIKQATLAGVRWVAVARAGSEIAAFAATIVLARLISPSEFGHAAVGLILLYLAMTIGAELFGTPLVQRRSVERGHFEGAAVISIFVGAALSGLALVAVPPLAAPLFGDHTADLLRLAAPAFLISAVGAVPKAILQRELRFKTLSVVDLASMLLATSATLALAVAGLGAEAIVGGALAGAAAATVLYLSLAPKVRPRWRPKEIFALARFGVPAALSGLVYTGYRNVDYAILGAKMSAAQVGFYYRAFQLGAGYQAKISGIMLRLALPVYSRSRSLADMKAMRGRIVAVHATVIFPLLLLYIVLAPDLVPFLFGTPWEPAVLPSQILAVSGLTYTVSTGQGALILAAGHPKALLLNNIISVVLYGLVVFFTASHGLVAVCIGVSTLNVVGLFNTHYFFLDRLVGLPTSHLLREIAPALGAGLVLVAVAYATAFSLRAVEAHALVITGAAIGLGGSAYLAALRVGFRSQWNDLTLLTARVLPTRLTLRLRAAVT